jgi:hypothetical protein
MFRYTEGPASVAFLGSDMHILMVGEDSRGDPDSGRSPSGVYKVNRDGSGSLVVSCTPMPSRTARVVPPDWGGRPLAHALERQLYVSDGNASVVYESTRPRREPRARSPTSRRWRAAIPCSPASPGRGQQLYVTN